ncbi:Co-chaperone Hsc20 [Sistotremastrum niveocremeum HHB9708]|uniref:Co-chaperone Hsc20 n=2 Tax=Sistotremastraceae TaxID=3402574 RepID=A0A164U6F6_9AGAM|nr:Co-chaperone Hsc20 [Sistotremastrum niveocremeum HHB9708]KZT44368.1 Co-chaperone Hsc20 [Sistotremastrum suecicum HHB10207 ss-3]
MLRIFKQRCGTLRLPSGHSRLYSTRQPRNCPKCGTPLPSALPTCLACSYIAPIPPEMSHEEILDIPQSSNPFKVDLKAMKQKFRQVQSICHPDKWSGRGGPQGSQIAAHQSAQINTAYTVLLDPVLRSQYILSRRAGLDADETDKLEDHEFLMEVMDAREELQTATEPHELESIRQRNKERFQTLVGEIERCIGEQDWQGAREATLKLKYWESLENAARDLAH